MTPELIEFVAGWEGLKLVPSPDPLVPGVWDCGYGHVLRGIIPDAITKEEAEDWLIADLSQAELEVLQLVGPLRLRTHQLDALTSFAFNLGSDKLASSTLMRKLRMMDLEGVCEEFPKWQMAGGKPRVGLLRRRLAEQAMFRDGDYSGRP